MLGGTRKGNVTRGCGGNNLVAVGDGPPQMTCTMPPVPAVVSVVLCFLIIFGHAADLDKDSTLLLPPFMNMHVIGCCGLCCWTQFSSLCIRLTFFYVCFVGCSLIV